MKAKKIEKSKFEPFNIELTIEKESEAALLYSIFSLPGLAQEVIKIIRSYPDGSKFPNDIKDFDYEDRNKMCTLLLDHVSFDVRGRK